MPVVRRPKGPSAIDRILQIVSTGASVVNTVTGIKERAAAGRRAERVTQLNEDEAERTENRLLREQYSEFRTQEVAKFLTEDQPRLALEAAKTIQAVIGIPSGLNTQTALNSALIANQLTERNFMLDPRAADLASSSITVDTVREPTFNLAFREMAAEQISKRLGRPVTPEEVPGNYVINVGSLSREQIGEEQDILYFLQNPDQARELAPIAANFRRTGRNESPAVTIARKWHLEQRTDEAFERILAGDPMGYELLATVTGESADTIWDVPENISRAWGVPGQIRMIVSANDKVLVMKDHAKALMATARGDLVEAAKFKEDSLRTLTDIYLRELPTGTVTVDEARMLARGCPKHPIIAEVECGISPEQWARDPIMQRLRVISKQFQDIDDARITMEYMGNAPAFSMDYRSWLVMKQFGFDPFDEGDRNDWTETLERLNSRLVRQGKKPLYAVPAKSDVKLWFDKSSWFSGLVKKGSLSDQIRPEDVSSLDFPAFGGGVDPAQGAAAQGAGQGQTLMDVVQQVTGERLRRLNEQKDMNKMVLTGIEDPIQRQNYIFAMDSLTFGEGDAKQKTFTAEEIQDLLRQFAPEGAQIPEVPVTDLQTAVPFRLKR